MARRRWGWGGGRRLIAAATAAAAMATGGRGGPVDGMESMLRKHLARVNTQFSPMALLFERFDPVRLMGAGEGKSTRRD